MPRAYRRCACTNAALAEVDPGCSRLAWPLRCTRRPIPAAGRSRCRATSCRKARPCQMRPCCAPRSSRSPCRRLGLCWASDMPPTATTRSTLHCARRPQAAFPRVRHNAHGPSVDYSGSVSRVTAGLERHPACTAEHQLDRHCRKSRGRALPSTGSNSSVALAADSHTRRRVSSASPCKRGARRVTLESLVSGCPARIAYGYRSLRRRGICIVARFA